MPDKNGASEHSGLPRVADKIGITIHEALRYGYGGLLAFIIALLLASEQTTGVVDDLGTTLVIVAVFAVGAAIYTASRSTIAPLGAGTAEWIHWRLFKWGLIRRQTRYTFFRETYGLNFLESEDAFRVLRATRPMLWDEDIQKRFYQQHSEIHMLYVTSLVSLVATWIDPLPLLWWISVISFVVGGLADILVSRQEFSQIKRCDSVIVPRLQEAGFRIPQQPEHDRAKLLKTGFVFLILMVVFGGGYLRADSDGDPNGTSAVGVAMDGVLASWVGAIATFLAVVVALFHSEIRGIWIRPRLDIRLDDSCFERTPIHIYRAGRVIQTFDSYYLRLAVVNDIRRAERAEGVELFVSAVEERQANGEFCEIASFLPMNLRWSHRMLPSGQPMVSLPGLAPGMRAYCDLGRVVNPEHRRDPAINEDLLGAANEQTIFALALEAVPSTRTHLLRPGIYRITILTGSANASPTPTVIELNLSGRWYAVTADMRRDGVGITIV